MPKLPSVADVERPSPRPTRGVVSLDLSAEKQKKLEGLAIAQVGEMVTDVGFRLDRMLKEQQDRFDRTRAEDALNQLRDKQLDLTVGEKNGFSLKKGADAVNQPLLKEYGQRLEDAAKGINEGLGNDHQREYFRPRAAIVGLQFKEDILKHVARENAAYAESVFKGTVDTEIRNATTRWSDPEAIGLSITRMHDAIKTEAKRAGWSPEITTSNTLAAMGKLHTAVLGQAIATEDYVYAKRYFDQVKAEIPPEVARIVQKQVADGTEKQVAAGYRRDFLNLRDNWKALDKLSERVTADKNLDLDRQNILVGQIASRIEVLQNRDRIQYEQGLRRLESAINKLNARTLSGYEPSIEQFGPYLAAAKGTELEPMVKNAIQLANATREFRLSPPPRQASMINDLDARYRENPASVDPTIISHLKTIHERQGRELEQDPTGFAYRQGLAPPLPINWATPGASPEQIIARVQTARAMNRYYGAPLKPLQPAEVDAIRASLELASPEKKMEWFGSLRASAGGDARGYSAMMSQLAPDDPALAMAGDYAGKGRGEPARLILEGQALLRPPRKADGTPDQGKLWPMPPEQDIRLRFQILEQGAFTGNAGYRNSALQATNAIYAKLSVDAGDTTGILKSDRYEQAFNLATGGVGSYGGRSVVLPYGMSQNDFERGMNLRINDIVASGRLDKDITASEIRGRWTIDPIGDGRYEFRNGNSFMVDKTGKAVVVNFNLEPEDRDRPERPMGRGGERMIAPWERR